MSIELFLIVNGLADVALLGATARALGLLRWKRVLACGGLCALCGALAAPRPYPFAAPCASLALLAVASLWLAWGCPARVLLKTAAFLCGGALLAGGASLLPFWALRGPVAFPCALCGATLLTLILAAKKPLSGDCQVRLSITVDGRTARFPALIDTGNRLREPMSGQPVVIAEARLLEGALPASGWRELHFGAVGGGGRMACFKPSGLWIEGRRGRTRAPEAWIALSPGPLPGSARALAPAEFAGFI